MVEEAIDSFGVSIPLLEFANVHSRCAGAGADVHAVGAQPSDTPESESSDDDEDEEDEKGAPPRVFRKFRFTTTTGQPLLESHPYIITRFVIPHTLILDSRLQFDSKAFQRYCGKLGIRNRYSTPAYP